MSHVPSEGWGRREGSLTCTQLRTLTDTCLQVGLGERGEFVPYT